MSFLRRMWGKITNPTGLVGRDLEGNRYYEYLNPESARSKRVVKYRRGYDMWTYVAGGKRLPVQWSAWLTHTRPHPPTLEELYADLERQRRVLAGAAMIEAREREAAATAQLAEPTQTSLPSLRTSESRTPEEARLATEEIDTTWQGKENPFAKIPKGADEPQAWAPRAARRGPGRY
ncbi:hypothetical protein BXZ70DRAFT_934511 [Cristinia sonorae]|uniref:NADH dehydrogenase [ubiquinone] 1 alpha subcomplex subunit n=1 Tax=Cristinia sonorae TaxID=1940300 RepID=A0A8K0XQH1_9AGAR|nr:hypothetical protein BXZ70DRAFT_934511 [Cristinia sonorae]